MSLKLIDPASKRPKYLQVSGRIAEAVRAGGLREGDSLPSINTVCGEYGVSRDTVVKAYAVLKRSGLVKSSHGKEFYICSVRSRSMPRVLLLMDEMSMYKRRILDGLSESLGSGAEIGVFFHNNELSVLKTLFSAYKDSYERHVVIPTYDLCGTQRFLAGAGIRDLIMLDRFAPQGPGGFQAVHQSFERGVQEALSSGIERLRRYRRLMLLSDRSSHIEEEIAKGLMVFISANGLRGGISGRLLARPGDAWIVLGDESLVELVKLAKAKGFKIGSELGVISYNDTPLKEIIEGGVTTIGADFLEMGRALGRVIKSGSRDSLLIPTSLTLRRTL